MAGDTEHYCLTYPDGISQRRQVEMFQHKCINCNKTKDSNQESLTSALLWLVTFLPSIMRFSRQQVPTQSKLGLNRDTQKHTEMKKGWLIGNINAVWDKQGTGQLTIYWNSWIWTGEKLLLLIMQENWFPDPSSFSGDVRMNYIFPLDNERVLDGDNESGM